jgi:tripartite-type tricarboxylate transporter receptor subunit TctC
MTGERAMERRTLLGLGLTAGAAVALPQHLSAQAAWPTRPVGFMIPFAPGGALDQVMLPMKPLLEERLGQSLLYSYKAGASGQLGWEQLVREGADGSAFGAVSQPHLVNTTLFQRTRYTLADFATVAYLTSDVPIWFVRKGSPIKTVKDAIEEARRRPNQVRVAIGSLTGEHFLTLAMVEEKAEVKFRTVNVGGGGRVMTNVAGGHFEVGIIRPASMLPMRDSLDGIGVVAARRSTLFPEAPTFDEMFPDWKIPHLRSAVGVLAVSAFRDQNHAGWTRLVEAVRDAAHSDAYREALARGGRELDYLGPDEALGFERELVTTMERYRPLIEQAQAAR